MKTISQWQVLKIANRYCRAIDSKMTQNSLHLLTVGRVTGKFIHYEWTSRHVYRYGIAFYPYLLSALCEKYWVTSRTKEKLAEQLYSMLQAKGWWIYRYEYHLGACVILNRVPKITALRVILRLLRQHFLIINPTTRNI